jgi:hypothetical protein
MPRSVVFYYIWNRRYKGKYGSGAVVVVYLLIVNYTDKGKGDEVRCHLPQVIRRVDSKKM